MNHTAKGYWIVRADISDMEQWKAYLNANRVSFQKFGARFLVRTDQFEVAEGQSRSRNILIEFPSYRAARDCWHSPEYQAAMKLRLHAATLDIVIVEGVSEAQA